MNVYLIEIKQIDSLANCDDMFWLGVFKFSANSCAEEFDIFTNSSQWCNVSNWCLHFFYVPALNTCGCVIPVYSYQPNKDGSLSPRLTNGKSTPFSTLGTDFRNFCRPGIKCWLMYDRSSFRNVIVPGQGANQKFYQLLMYCRWWWASYMLRNLKSLSKCFGYYLHYDVDVVWNGFMRVCNSTKLINLKVICLCCGSILLFLCW